MKFDAATLSPLKRILDIETAVNSTRKNPIMFAHEDMDFMVKAFRVLEKKSPDVNFDVLMGKEESR